MSKNKKHGKKETVWSDEQLRRAINLMFGFDHMHSSPSRCLSLPTYKDIPVGCFALAPHGFRPSYTAEGGALNVPTQSLFKFSSVDAYTVLYYWKEANVYIISDGFNFFAVNEACADKLTLTNMRRNEEGIYQFGTAEDGEWEFTVEGAAKDDDFSDFWYIPRNLYANTVSNVVVFDGDLSKRFKSLLNDGALGYAGYYRGCPALVFYASTESGIDLEPALLYDKVAEAMRVKTLTAQKVYSGGRKCLVYPLCESAAELPDITLLSEVGNFEELYASWSEDERRTFLRFICLDNCMGTYNRTAESFVLYKGKPLGFVNNRFCMSKDDFLHFDERVGLPSVFTAKMVILLTLYAAKLHDIADANGVALKDLIHSDTAEPLFAPGAKRGKLEDIVGEAGVTILERSALAFGHPIFFDKNK